MKKKRGITLLALCIVIALALGAVLLRKHRMEVVSDLASIGATPWALRTAEVHQGTLSSGFLALASVSGSTDITISSQISGTIEEMGPREGVEVNAGDVLARISVAELQQQREGLVAQREAALAEEKRTQDEYERQKQLKKKGLTTVELLEAKHSAAISGQKQVDNIDRQMSAMDVRIGYGTVYAPKQALVAARLMEVGDVAQPGKPIYRLTVDSAARIKVKLPQQVLEQVHPGTEVILSHGSQTMTVALSRIFPALDAQAQGVAEADLAAMPFQLPSGARIPARVILHSVDEAIQIPHRALVRTDNKGFLFKVVSTTNGSRLQRVKVNIVLDGDSGLAVEGNLKMGDQVVIAHQSVLMQLRDGDPVIVRPGADRTSSL